MTVEDCMYFNPNKKSYKCEIGIVDSQRIGKRYNCAKYGQCACFKSQAQHELDVAESKEQWEKKTYERLKKKFEPELLAVQPEGEKRC